MDWFKFVSENHRTNNYSNENVAMFVIKKKITPEQYEQITGKVYK